MERRREYVAPAIAWEDVLEQTSLACNATSPPPPLGPNAQCFAGEPLQVFAQECVQDVTKGGSFAALETYCEVHFDWPGGVVVLS